PALSSFRIAKLVDRLTAREPAVTGLDSRYIHFADLERPLTNQEAALLEQLLTYGPRIEASSRGGGESVLVVPRFGTISPWSSKATDIARVCGLDAVRRIERGIVYRVIAPKPLGRERLAALALELLDRMTETVLFDPHEAQGLF